MKGELHMLRPRVVIADDHTLVAELCKNLLEGEFSVVGIVRDGRAMVRAAAALRPEVILVDVAMPVLNGLDAGEQVKKMWPAIKQIYLTMNSDPEVAAEAFRRGASGYLLKTCASSELVAAVRQVLRGNTYLSRTLPKGDIEYMRRQNRPEAHLTERQGEVLQLLAEGKSMKEIGDVLNITIRTVAFHKYRMMEVLGVRTNADLIRYAVKSHVVAA